MNDKDPKTLEEFNQRYLSNIRYEGAGLKVRSVMPCMFCAAPEFMSYSVLDIHKAMREGATCNTCKRSGHFVFADSSNASFAGFVQTGGDDPQKYLGSIIRQQEVEKI